MVDAFPLPRHREKLCRAGSRFSYEGSELNGAVVRHRSTTRSCAEITRAVLADIHRVVEQLQIMMSYDSSHGNNRSKNAWKKLPKMRKKPFDGWPVQEVSEGRASLRTASPSADDDDDAFPNDHKRYPRISDKGKERHREYGLATAVQQTPSPQNTDDEASQPSAQLISPYTLQASTRNLPDVASALSSPAASSSSCHHDYSYSPATFSMAPSPLSRSCSAPFSPSRERLYVHPTEWTIEEAVNWLRSKGFEDDVCEKFIQQETAGDALLNLDATSLKTEIGIVAYGKRFRIANAIEDLRRVASVRFPLVKPRGLPAQGTGLKPLLLRSASVGNLMSPPAQPILGHLPEMPMVPPCPEPDPDVRSTVEKPTESEAETEVQGLISPPLSPRSSQYKTAVVPREKPLGLLPFRSDGALRANAMHAAIEREGGKRGNAAQYDNGTMYLATQRRPRFDHESSSSSPVKRPFSPPMELATPQPRVAQLKGQSLSGRRKGSLDALYEDSPTSTLVGTAGFVPKFRQSSFSSTGSARPLSPDSDSFFWKEDKHEKHESSSSGDSKGKSPAHLRRSASLSLSSDVSRCASPKARAHRSVDTVLVQIGTSDHEGWMRKKGGNFNTWKNRFLVLKGSHLYWLESDSPLAKAEGYVNVVGCRIVPDENIDPGSYGFKLLRGSDCAHLFSSDDQTIVREWVKALLKPNIKRDHMQPTMSPSDINVVSLEIALAMHPRPPSPDSAAATQRNTRRENSKQSSTRGEATLTKMPSMPLLGRNNKISSRSQAGPPDPLSASTALKAPVRPPRDARRNGLRLESCEQAEQHQSAEQGLIRWANGHLPGAQIDPTGSNCGGLELLRIAESIKNVGSSCTPDRVISPGPDHQMLEELFTLIDFLLVEDVKANIDDVRRNKRDKVIQMLRALRAWESHRAILQPIEMRTPQAGPSLNVV